MHFFTGSKGHGSFGRGREDEASTVAIREVSTSFKVTLLINLLEVGCTGSSLNSTSRDSQ